MKKITILHSYPIWLGQTLTWLHGQVSQLQLIGVDAHVVCEKTESLDQYFVNNIHSLENQSLIKQRWDKGLRKFRIRRHLNYLVSVGKEIDASIVHSHFGNIGWANLGAVRKLGAKHVVNFYGLDVNKLPVLFPIWRKRYCQLFEEADLFLCEGSHMARCLIELGCSEDKIKVQHLGVDLDRFLFKPRMWSAGEPLKVLIAASFREKKGIPYAIEALAIINKTVPIQLTIIGDAGSDIASQQEKQKILHALETTDLIANCRMLGYQPHSVMLEEAYSHHLFMHPSVTASDGDTEGGAPVSIIEMISTGMPVVSTWHCDIPEVMLPEAARFLAPERDVEALVEIVRAMLRDWLSIYIPLRNLRSYIELGYDQKKQVKQLTEHYQKILEKF